MRAELRDPRSDPAPRGRRTAATASRPSRLEPTAAGRIAPVSGAPAEGRTLDDERIHDTLARELGRLRPRMTSVALRFAPSRDCAEDIVQSAFEKAIRHFQQFDGRSRFSTWLHRIVVNEALMWLRSEKRRRLRQTDRGFEPDCGRDPGRGGEVDWADPSPDVLQRLTTRQRHQLLYRGLARLPAREREVLQACALDGASYEEFSQRLGIQPATAKSRAFRGRQRLRRWLDEV